MNVKTIDSVLIILALLVSKSLYYETFGENKLLVLMFAIVLLSVVYKTYLNRYNFSKKSIVLYCMIVGAIFVNPNAKMSTSLVMLASLTTGLLFTNSIKLQQFTIIYFKFTKIIMLASLLRYLFIFANIESPMPDFVSIINDHYHNFIFFGTREFTGTYFNLIRNNGLWWEPGSFQVIINLSFLLAIIFLRVSFKEYLLFLVVIITTFSTAGVLIFSLLSLIYFRDSKHYKLILVFLAVISPIATISSYYQTVIDDKLSLENASAQSRYRDLTLELRMFLEYPFIGTGMGNLEILDDYASKYGYGTGSNGVLYLLRNLGLLSLIIMIPVFFPGYLINLRFKEKLLASISLILIFLTQNFTIILIFSLMVFYGARKYGDKDFEMNSVFLYR